MPKQEIPDEEEITDLIEVYARNAAIGVEWTNEKHAFVHDYALAVKPRTTPGGLQQKRFPEESAPFDYLR